MPLVFVHGVANREGPEQEKAKADRDEMFRRALLQADDGARYAGTVLNPFWGKLGATFRWNQASVPAGAFASLGAADAAMTAMLSESPLPEGVSDSTLLSDVARQSLASAVDLLLAGASAEDAAGTSRAERSDFARDAADYARRNPAPAWLTLSMTNDDFVEALVREVMAAHPAPASTVQAQGLSDLKNALLQGADRVRSTFNQATTAVGDFVTRKKDQAANFVSQKVIDAVRGDLHAKISTFVGDIVVYFSERGTPAAPGAIPIVVLSDLFKAFKARTNTDPLIVVGHSLGGVILYDLLTSYLGSAPAGFQVDTLVTVGSQVGVFEEMKQYHASDRALPDAARPRVRVPGVVKRWINVFDTTDVLSFVTGPVFDGAEDFAFSSETDVFSAHSSYFLRASFYERLRARFRS